MTPEQITVPGFYLTWTKEDHESGQRPEIAEVWQSPQGVFMVSDEGGSGWTKLKAEAFHEVLLHGPISFSLDEPETTFVDPLELYPNHGHNHVDAPFQRKVG